MLNKQNRLKTSFEFGLVRRRGSFSRFEMFDLYVLENFKFPAAPIKFGIVISNKFSKSAVIRNRVRRVFREYFRLNINKFKNGFWVVVYPRYSSLGKGYEEINQSFNKVLSKLPFVR